LCPSPRPILHIHVRTTTTCRARARATHIQRDAHPTRRTSPRYPPPATPRARPTRRLARSARRAPNVAVDPACVRPTTTTCPTDHDHMSDRCAPHARSTSTHRRIDARARALSRAWTPSPRAPRRTRTTRDGGVAGVSTVTGLLTWHFRGERSSVPLSRGWG